MNFRSMLFTPAKRLDRIDKALAVCPDWVAIDLEDGVSLEDKDAARTAVGGFATTPSFEENATRLALRINTLATAHGLKDMVALLNWPAWPKLLILPKIESATQINQVAALIRERNEKTLIMATLETAKGIARADRIVEGTNNIAAIGYGSADHMAEVGGTMTTASLALGRASVLNAAAIAGVPALDGVWADMNDEAGLSTDAKLGQEMGFAGKIAIHPAQVALINEAFSPSKQDLADAHALVDAASRSGGGAFSFRGKMVDPPLLARALRLTQSERSGVYK